MMKRGYGIGYFFSSKKGHIAVLVYLSLKWDSLHAWEFKDRPLALEDK